MLVFKARQQNTSIPTQLLWKPLTKGWQNYCLNQWEVQDVQDPEKVSTNWVRNSNKIVNKMNNTISSMIGMKPKDAIKLDTVRPDKIYSEETILREDGLYKQDGPQTLSGVRKHIAWIELYKNQAIMSCTIYRAGLIRLLCVKN